MAKQKSFKSGFRTFEMDALYHKSEFFRRFIKNYQPAVKELTEMLPLFQSVFGEALDIDVMEHMSLFEVNRFDERFMIQPDKMLSRCCDSSMEYESDIFWREPVVPDFIRMPDDHPCKVDEEYYKRKLETSIVWGVAKLRAETGETVLLDYLKNFQELKQKKREEFVQLAEKYCEENSVDLSETGISGAAYQLTDEFFENNNLYRYDHLEPVLKTFWKFYEKFHAWIGKYYLHRAWLRRSFFIALRRGLNGFWADIGSPIYAPASLKAAFYGADQDEWGYLHSDIPGPDTFQFTIIKYTTDEKKPIANDEQWTAEGYSLFYTPLEYTEKALAKFREAVEQVEYFGAEAELAERFVISVNEFADEGSENDESLRQEFKEHLRRFPLFKVVVDNRAQVQRDFQNHIQKYLDLILPIIGKHLRTKAGAPPKYDRINWLLDWNIDNLTGREIVEKYDLSDESTFWKALDDLKLYNLPIKEKSSDRIDWNDDWFMERMKAGFPDLKKLENKTRQKK